MRDLITVKNFNYISVLTSLFFIIFTSNFSGLLPYTQTVTSQLLFTLVLSFLTMFLIWLHTVVHNKILMLNHFLPNGAPLLLIPFIIIIELISNISRVVSLAVRLFANMTSGHALLKILAGFGLGALSLVGAWGSLFVFPVLIIFIITLLELIIAFLQTYVFITLTLIYINEQE
jgi:F-type H+-transporting ATPase subunit a